jgi:hypothetical protein
VRAQVYNPQRSQTYIFCHFGVPNSPALTPEDYSVESGSPSFLGSVGKPVAMEHVFAVVCFCTARQMLTNSMSARKRAWQDASSPPWVKSFSLAGVPAAG